MSISITALDTSLVDLSGIEAIPAGDHCLLVAHLTDGSHRTLALSAAVYDEARSFAAEVSELALSVNVR